MAPSSRDLIDALCAQSELTPVQTAGGVVRLDFKHGARTEKYYLTIDKGIVTVSREGGEADCVISGEAATLDAVLSGKANAMAALLRGAIDAEGKVILMAALQRLFPDEKAKVVEPAAGYARRQS
jgi:putative sterol carrier protein